MAGLPEFMTDSHGGGREKANAGGRGLEVGRGHTPVGESQNRAAESFGLVACVDSVIFMKTTGL